MATKTTRSRKTPLSWQEVTALAVTGTIVMGVLMSEQQKRQPSRDTTMTWQHVAALAVIGATVVAVTWLIVGGR